MFILDVRRPGPVAGVGGRPLPLHLPSGHGRGQASQQRLGHAQHQQPQRQHPQEVLSWGPGLLTKVDTCILPFNPFFNPVFPSE